MFAAERYVARALLAVLARYVQDLEPEHAQVSLWGGGVALQKLVLRPDALRRMLGLPLVIASGRVHELLVQVPWMKIVSEPVVVTVNTVECVLSVKESAEAEAGAGSEAAPGVSSESATGGAEAQVEAEAEAEAEAGVDAGYVAALVRRVVSNISVRVNRLILKLVEDDAVLSLNIESLCLDSADAQWNPAFTDVEPPEFLARKLLRVTDLTLCLDRRDAAGEIRRYEEPLLYRCHLEFRMVSRLAHPSARRAEFVHVWVRSERLELGASSAQLHMLCRLLLAVSAALAAARDSRNAALVPVRTHSLDSEARQPSWSDWVRSWVPGGAAGAAAAVADEPPPPARRTLATALVGVLTLTVKVRESERGRARAVVCLRAEGAAVAARTRGEELLSVHAGAARLAVESEGACVCRDASAEPPASREVYLECPTDTREESDSDSDDEKLTEAYGQWPPDADGGEQGEGGEGGAARLACPALAVHFLREMRPPPDTPYSAYTNYSQWQETCSVRARVGRTQATVSSGALHRLRALLKAEKWPTAPPEAAPAAVAVPPLSEEEEEALREYIPVRSVRLDWRHSRVCVPAAGGCGEEAPGVQLPVLVVEATRAAAALTEPLYPARVAAAACQLPGGPVVRAAHRRLSLDLLDVRARLVSASNQGACVARADFRAAAAWLLEPQMYAGVSPEPTLVSYTLRIKEAGACGSGARLRAAWLLATHGSPLPLRDTTLTADAFNDREAVHLDATLEECVLRTYRTRNTHTRMLLLQAARATVLRAEEGVLLSAGADIEQAWVFSAPDLVTSNGYLRAALQTTKQSAPGALDYAGVWSEPASAALDPLLAELLRYRPTACRAPPAPPPPASYEPAQWDALEWYGRVRRLVACAELGPLSVYVPLECMSAVGSESLRAAAERHIARDAPHLLVFSTGKLAVQSNSSNKHIWQAVRHDGPTILRPPPAPPAIDRLVVKESFPWKIQLSNSWCHTVSRRAPAAAGAARSQLKVVTTETRTVLEQLSTSVTLSVLAERERDRKPSSMRDHFTRDNKKNDGFTDVQDFKPKSLKELVHGPKRRDDKEHQQSKKNTSPAPEERTRLLGACLYVETEPLALHLHSVQVESLCAALHWMVLVSDLCNGPPPPPPLAPPPAGPPPPAASASRLSSEWLRATTESAGSAVAAPIAASHSHSDLISIFERPQRERRVSLWLQWVVARVSVRWLVADERLALDAEGLTFGADLQLHYSQYKVKLEMAEVTAERQTAGGAWETSPVGGRVLRALPRDDAPDAGLLSITVTAATSCSLRSKWPGEAMTALALPLSRRSQGGSEIVWELSVRASALEAVLSGVLLSRVLAPAAPLVRAALPPRPPRPPAPRSYPLLLYVEWGGARVLLPADALLSRDHDTLIVEIKNLSIDPHPDNPICRHSLRPEVWTAGGAGGADRQYSVSLRSLSLHTACWNRRQEETSGEVVAARENPARVWSVRGAARERGAAHTTLVRSTPLTAVLAPAVVVRGALLAAPAAEVVLPEDVEVEVCAEQLRLLSALACEAQLAWLTCIASNSSYDLPAPPTPPPAAPPPVPDSGCASAADDASTRSERRWTDSGGAVPGEMYVTARALLLTLYHATDVDAGASVPDTTQMSPETAAEREVEWEEAAERRAVRAALLHARLLQPILLLTAVECQVSVYDVWAGCASDASAAANASACPLALLDAARGAPDPATDIRPALLTGRARRTAAGDAVRLALDRPLRLQLCEQRARRLCDLAILVQEALEAPLETSSKLLQLSETSEASEAADMSQTEGTESLKAEAVPSSVLQRLHKALGGVSGVEVSTSQLVVRLAEEDARLTCGASGLTARVAARARPDRLEARCLVRALAVSAPAGAAETDRLYLLHPTTLGMECSVEWEVWRREEGGARAATRLLLDAGRVRLEAAPQHAAALRDTLRHLTAIANVSATRKRRYSSKRAETQPPPPETPPPSRLHHYRDDLRTGAFKLSSAGQTGADGPVQAYEVRVGAGAVCWRYPHPRALTRLTLLPLPMDEEEDDDAPLLALEWWCDVTRSFRPLAIVAPRRGRPTDLRLPLSQACWASTWRVRTCLGEAEGEAAAGACCPAPSPPFDPTRYMNQDPAPPPGACVEGATTGGGWEARVAGALRVDSALCARRVPTTWACARAASLELRLLAAAPAALGGGRDLPALAVRAEPLELRAQCAPALTTLHAQLSIRADVLDTEALAMREAARAAAAAHAATRRGGGGRALLRVDTLRLALAPHQLHVLRRLHAQWTRAALDSNSESGQRGWVRWRLHNATEVELRAWEEGAAERVLLRAGERAAYVWRRARPRRLRIATPRGGLQCDRGVEVEASKRATLPLDPEQYGVGARAHVRVTLDADGARRVTVAGRLHLANVLPRSFHYKVRRRTVGGGSDEHAGTLPARSADCTVLCGAGGDLVIKLRLAEGGTGWTGEVPLRECPNRNVPWLVKVPCEGDLQFVCVWCRAVLCEEDRILLVLWPLYLLTSHLPHDIQVITSSEAADGGSERRREQPARGRGATTHLLTPGTSATQHNLTFRYLEGEGAGAVTREAVPLHYALAEASVLQPPPPPPADLDALLLDLHKWLAEDGGEGGASGERGDEDEDGESRAWPYSVVTRHRAGAWLPCPQPRRTDVIVRYERAAAADGGAGSALRVVLAPRSLFCNAAPLPLTLRANDFTPLCTVPPGRVAAPHHAFAQTAEWFVSVECGGETWVSRGVRVRDHPPGPYERLPPAVLAPRHAAPLHIRCRDQVLMLSLYYEVRHGAEVVGASCAHVVRNLTGAPLLVCGVAVCGGRGRGRGAAVTLRPRRAHYVLLPPHADDSCEAMALDKLWLAAGGEAEAAGEAADEAAEEWRTYLCVAPADAAEGEPEHAPVRLDGPAPARTTLALRPARAAAHMGICAVVQRAGGRTVATLSAETQAQLLVRNRTSRLLLLAAPAQAEGSSEEECAGVHWQRSVPVGARLPYSTPAHAAWLARGAPDEAAPPARLLLQHPPEGGGVGGWSEAVEAGGAGARLVRLACGGAVKLTTRRRAHRTLLTLADVAPEEVSASDVRRRLEQPPPPALAEGSGEEQAGPAAAPPATPARAPCADPAGCDCDSDEEDGGWPGCCDRADDELASLDEETEEEEEEEEEEEVEEERRGVTAWRCRAAVRSASLRLAHGVDPLLALYLDELNLTMLAHPRGLMVVASAGEVQLDNAAAERGAYDFSTVLVGRGAESNHAAPAAPTDGLLAAPPPPHAAPRLRLALQAHSYTDEGGERITEVCGVEVWARELAVYLEDRYLVALVAFAGELGGATHGSARPARDGAALVQRSAALDAAALARPLRLRLLRLHPLQLLLSLHTSSWLYLALDHSPLQLEMFERRTLAATPGRLARALAMHYLAGAIFGAGWVVGGLEALGAPGTLARRVTEGARAAAAGGGARALCGGVASGALHSLAALCGSLARNLDLVAGDDEHTERAAAARRRRPRSLPAALATGLEGLAAALLGGVGGLAHHPLHATPGWGLAAALRRALLGAVAKPLGAAADLVALSSQGLLTQAGWDALPQARREGGAAECAAAAAAAEAAEARVWWRGLRRGGGEEARVLLACAVRAPRRPLTLLLTSTWLVLVEAEGEAEEEGVVEALELRSCELAPPAPGDPLQVEVMVAMVARPQRTPSAAAAPAPPDVRAARDADLDADAAEEPDYEARAAALERVAQYTGATVEPSRRSLRLRTADAARALQLRAHLEPLLLAAAPADSRYPPPAFSLL